jgi:hypothetical protein
LSHNGTDAVLPYVEPRANDKYQMPPQQPTYSGMYTDLMRQQ